MKGINQKLMDDISEHGFTKAVDNELQRVAELYGIMLGNMQYTVDVNEEQKKIEDKVLPTVSNYIWILSLVLDHFNEQERVLNEMAEHYESEEAETI